MDFRIPFSGRSHFYTESEIEVAVEAIRNAVPLTQGNYLKEEVFNIFAFQGFLHNHDGSSQGCVVRHVIVLSQF